MSSYGEAIFSFFDGRWVFLPGSVATYSHSYRKMIILISAALCDIFIIYHELKQRDVGFVGYELLN